MRLACLWVPHCSAAAVIREEPALRGRPVAVLEGVIPTRTTVDATDEAWQAGVRPSMPEAEAMGRCPGLIVRAASGERDHATQEALLAVALGTSPRVEDGQLGIVYVDLDGLGTLFGAELAIGERLVRHCRGIGLPACVGIAGSRAAALSAAKLGRRVSVVPPGDERATLAPTPLALLGLASELSAVFARWGVQTLGDLTELPRAGLVTRLGSAGLAAQDLARGIDPKPFQPHTPPPFYQEGHGLEWEIETLDALMPLLGSLLDRLGARLEVAHVATDQLTLTLGLAGGGHHTRVVDLAYPMAEGSPMRALLRLDLEAHPPPAAIVHVALAARPVRVRAGQSGFWHPGEPAARELTVVLARLAALVGSANLGSPVLADSHRPDAIVMTPFVLADDHQRSRHAHRIEPNVPEHLSPIALRRLRPPRPADVDTSRQRPRAVSAGPVAGRVVACAGPWRLSGEWWREDAWARDEWDVALSDGTLGRLVWDRLARTWALDGTYD